MKIILISSMVSLLCFMIEPLLLVLSAKYSNRKYKLGKFFWNTSRFLEKMAIFMFAIALGTVVLKTLEIIF